MEWKSSDTAVATVNDGGEVTGAGVGKATITYILGGKSDTCEITVVAAPTE